MVNNNGLKGMTYTSERTDPTGNRQKNQYQIPTIQIASGQQQPFQTHPIAQINPQDRSPSPDTLSDVSANSLSFLPHPRPKHNIREQLLNAGLTGNSYSSQMGASSMSLFKHTPGSFTTSMTMNTNNAPNFPQPNPVHSVAMRISALEKRPGTPTLLSLAGTNTIAGQQPREGTPARQSSLRTASFPSSAFASQFSSNISGSSFSSSGNGPPSTPMSPKSTVFRTKPVIHMEEESMEDINSVLVGNFIL